MEKKKRRSHAEVVAAREYYEAERQKHLQEKEAKRLERQKLIEERAQRRAEREARKTMSEEDRAKSLQKERKTKIDKVSRKLKNNPAFDGNLPYYTMSTYKDSVEIGDLVQIRFAGRLIWGTLIKIGKAFSDDQELRQENITLYTVESDGYKYPVRRENILNKQVK